MLWYVYWTILIEKAILLKFFYYLIKDKRIIRLESIPELLIIVCSFSLFIHSLNNATFYWLLRIYLVLHLHCGVIHLREYVKCADYFAFTCKLKGQFIPVHKRNCAVEDMAQWQSTWSQSVRTEIWIFGTHRKQDVVTSTCYLRAPKWDRDKRNLRSFQARWPGYQIRTQNILSQAMWGPKSNVVHLPPWVCCGSCAHIHTQKILREWK